MGEVQPTVAAPTVSDTESVRMISLAGLVGAFGTDRGRLDDGCGGVDDVDEGRMPCLRLGFGEGDGDARRGPCGGEVGTTSKFLELVSPFIVQCWPLSGRPGRVGFSAKTASSQKEEGLAFS